MKLLIIGGSQFVGRGIIDYALKQGHEITMFNRGKTNPDLYPEVERLTGDRDGNLDALKGRKWDAVIDTCGYIPRIVKQSADLLKDAVDTYCFISTLSVYSEWDKFGVDENGALGTMEDETMEEITGESYGPLKVLCEKAVMEAFPENHVIVRPGLIVGPYDPTDRFTYYPVRIAKSGEVLAPGRPEREIQFIDYRDLGIFTTSLVERKKFGIYNGVGPEKLPTMEEYLLTAKKVSGSDAEIVWIDEQFLLDNDVQPWMEATMWFPEIDPNMAGGMTFSRAKSIKNGLTFRPMEETIRDTIEWASKRPEDHEWRAGMKAEKEAKVIKAWKEKNQS